MPDKVLRLKSRAGFATFFAIAAACVAVIQAADVSVVTETLGDSAERWGLWATVAMVLVGATLWAYYRQNMFVQEVLVDLVKQVTSALDRNTDALSDAPCGKVTPPPRDP
jgi:hypothetical protein